LTRHLLTGEELTPREVARIVARAGELKADPGGSTILSGRSVALIFEKPSTRTRVSFETGVAELGGHPLVLRSGELQLSRGESIRDTALVLSRHVAAIGIRTGPDADVEQLAAHATVPVVNMLTAGHHPCQALADLQTLQERFGRLDGLKLAYVGDGNNVAQSLAIGCALTGAELTIAHPEGHAPDERIVQLAAKLGAAPSLTEDPHEAVAGARAVYTDVWASMGQEEEAEERKKKFAPYQVDEELMGLAEEDAIFLHCLPAHRGEEVTAGVIDGPRSRIFDQAENRLHAQKALLYLLLG
jgi:ornithine carbamoyltransferase